MDRVFSILILLSSLFPWQVQGQQFQVIDEPVCWTIGSVDSSLTRAQYVSVSGLVLTVYYVNADGNSVDVSAGGNLSFGICGCCDNVPPVYAEEVPYIDTIATLESIIRIPPPPVGADSLASSVTYCEINNITAASQITITFESADLPDLVVNSPGYYSNLNGSINYTYTQTTATKATFSAEVYSYFNVRPGSTPQRVSVVATNAAGSLTVYERDLF